jgi:hypothetical protein
MLKIFGRDLVVASYVRLFEFWKKKESLSFFSPKLSIFYFF